VLTLSESGLPGFEVIGFFGVMAPAATPPATRLNAEIAPRPSTHERFAAQGPRARQHDGRAVRRLHQGRGEKWGRVIKEAGITAK